MILNIQVVIQTYDQTSGKCTRKQEWTGNGRTDGRTDRHTDRQTDRRMDRWERYKGLYAQMAEPLVSRKIGHY